MPEQTVSLAEGSVAVIPQKVEKKSGKRIGFNYIILKSLKESKKNDVVKCIYIKGITNFGLCVIKEGSQGDTKDANGRDIQDRLKWQRTLHERLAKKVRMPKFLDSFEENGNYYLVIEYIKGRPFNDFVRKSRTLRRDILEGTPSGLKVLQHLADIVRLLEELHKNNVVHRDVTLNNFMIMPSGKVAVIDMELSYSLSEQFPAPPFALGTHGYMSPEQEAVSIPTIKEDIFSIGAILLHVWSGISPFKLIKIPGEKFRRAINFFVEDELMVDLIGRCTQWNPSLRPDIAEILQQLKEYGKSRDEVKPRSVPNKILYTTLEVTEIIQRGILALADPILCDKERGWFSDHLSERPESSNDIRKTWYASFNRGVSGILYFLSRAHAVGYDLSPVAIPAQQGLDLIKIKYLSDSRNGVKPGLYFGGDGIAMALVEIYRNRWMEAEVVMKTEWAYLLSGTTEGMNLSEGMAGQGVAHLYCAGLIKGTREKYFAEELMSRQQPEGKWPLSSKGRVPFIENGQAGIIYFLLQYGMSNGNKDALNRAVKGLQYLMINSVSEADAVYWRYKERSANYRWNDGSPGIALAFLKAFEATGERTYAEWAERALNGIIESRIWASLSMCQGMAGLGETYLEAARILGEEKWFAKASGCMQVIMHTQQQAKNGGAFWYVERERHPVGNMYMGNAGVMHFLLRLLYAGRFGFPGL